LIYYYIEKAMNDPKLELFLLGKPQIVLAGEVQLDLLVKAQALLFYLALEPTVHSRAALATLLWSEMEDGKARANLRTALSRLRPQFQEFLITTRTTVSLAEGCGIWIDAVVFSSGLQQTTREDQRAALNLYQDDLLADLQLRDAPVFEEWLLMERLQYRQTAIDGLDKLAYETWQQGDLRQALTDFRRLLTLEPYRESAHRGVMRLLLEMGNRAGALAQYERCKLILRAELGVEPAPSTMTLYDEIKRSDKVTPRSHHVVSASLPPHNLPAETTSFHGRSQEILQVQEVLQEDGCRLLVLTGLGGVGKTRLALTVSQRVLRDHSDWFPDGVFWVVLTAVNTPSAIIIAISEALGFRFSGSADGQAQLFAFLSQKRMLLVLDNLEQLVDAAPVFSDLLQAAPHVKLLATSREKLNLYEEWRLPISGLPYPEPTDEKPGDYEAVQLFTQRARRVDMGFDWQSQAEDVIAICRLLEGLPLGLELAAAWAHVFSLREITQAIAQNQEELAVSWQNVPERHHSLAAVFTYSWQLLISEEQSALVKLSVFRQGFTGAAAKAVAGASPRLLVGLVEKSLVRQQAHGRYDMHEQLRQYAWEKLSPVEKEATQTCHMTYFASYLGERETAVIGKDQAQFIRTLNRDGENVWLAWETAVQLRAVDALAQMTLPLYHFYTKQGRQRDGFALYQMAVDAISSDERELTPHSEKLLAGCLIWQGRCGELIHQGFTEPERLLKKGLVLARQYALSVETAQALLGLGLLALYQSREQESYGFLQESLEICDETRNSWTMPSVLQLMGWLRSNQGELDQAKKMTIQAIELQMENGDLSGEASALTTLGKIETDYEAYDLAEVAYARAWKLCQETGHRVGQAQALTGLFVACMRQEKVETAVRYAQKALQVNQDVGDQLGMGIAYHNLGYACANQADHMQAVQYYRKALGIYEAIGGNEHRIENTNHYLVQSLDMLS